MTTLSEIINHAYETRWRWQKDGERTRSRALEWMGGDPLTQTDVNVCVQVWKERGLSNATINRRLAAMACAYRCAYDDGLIDTPGPRFKRLPEDGGRDRVPTRDEVARMLRAFRALGYSGFPRLARFLYRTGMRRSEALSLQAGTSLHVEDRVGGEFHALLRDTKNGTSRTVPIPAACSSWFYGMHFFDAPFNHSESAFSAAWRRAREAAGIGDWFVPHCLRHARATELVRAGTPIPVVAKILGHRDWNTTKRYTHPTQEDCRAALERRM